MSTLTKVFVVLHVVLSLLLTAGLVVFVNRVDNFNKSNAGLNAQVATLTSSVTEAQANTANVRTALERTLTQANAQVAAVQKELAAAQGQLAERDARLADASSKAALSSADITRLTEALKASEDQKGKLGDQIVAVRTDNDSLVKKNAELNGSVSDLTNKLDSTERDRRNATEQLAEAKAKVEKLTTSMTDAGLNPNASASAGLSLAAPAINAVVTETKTLPGDIPFASISVGRSEGVTQGMVFNVVDRDKGEFLGQLTVQSVDEHNAAGRLQGPGVNQVKQGTEVRTQL